MIESVPLIQDANNAQQINASIIAMKKASKELDEKILKLNNLNKELDKKIAVLDNGLAQEITDRENADSAEVTNRNTAITDAVNALDVASVGGSGKYISAISETDGKISATVSDLTSVIESGNNQPATSGGVSDAISQISETNVIYDSTITDCNNAWQKGKTKTYWLNPDVANVPNTLNGWYVISQCNNNQISGYNYITQIATVGSNVSTNEMYIRHAYLSGSSVVFSSWAKLKKSNVVQSAVVGGATTYTISIAKSNGYRNLKGVFVGNAGRQLPFSIFVGGYNNIMSIPEVAYMASILSMTYDRNNYTFTFTSTEAMDSLHYVEITVMDALS